MRKISAFSSANVTDGNLLLKECTHMINNKIKLHILGVPTLRRSDNSTGQLSRQYTGHCKATEEYLENVSQEKDVEAGFRYSWRKMELASQDRTGWRQVVSGL